MGTPALKKSFKRQNVLTTTSRKRGVLGLLERFMRRFRNTAFSILFSPVIALSLCCVGLALVPSIYIVSFVIEQFSHLPKHLYFPILGLSFAIGYFAYGLTLIFIVPLVNFLIPFKVKAWRGIWYSIPAIPWFIHNALTYTVRYTFLEFLTPSPLNVLFYRMMGMKVGKGSVINSTNISDPCLIEIGDYVTIGGSAHILAHYGQSGFLILAPVKIGNGTNIGLKASVMGGVMIGEKCNVKPHTVLLPKTILNDGETV